VALWKAVLVNFESFKLRLKVSSLICSRSDPFGGGRVGVDGKEEAEKERCPNLLAGERKEC
jgi:hypothetical protein